MFFRSELQMSAEAVAEIIQLVIAPTVMISGCTMIQNGVLGRYSQISIRLRALNRERAELLATDNVPESVFGEAIGLIDGQLISLCHRHQLIQKASLILYGAIGMFILSMLTISLTKIFAIASLSSVVLILFLLGTSNLLIGVILASLEVQISHQAIRSEMKWVMTLAKPTFQPHHPLPHKSKS
jgi:hypothetical protein